MHLRSTIASSFGFRRSGALAVTAASLLFAACASAPDTTKHKRSPVDPGADYFGDPPSDEQGLTPTTNPDSGAFGASSRPAPPPKDGGGEGPHVDGGTDDSGTVTTKTYCTGALAAGDLAIAELLIASRAGAGDDGEWVEIHSTRTCTLKLKGLAIESPRGATQVDSTTISEDFELAPGGSFIVADSADSAKNHGLPGKVFAWNASDVLKNDGDTVTLKLGSAVIDAITYPAFSNLGVARTLAFPSDCPATVRGDWARWSLTFTAWAPGFKGTPNAANADVACY